MHTKFRSFLVVLLCATFLSQAQAQLKTFNEGDQNLHLGIGLLNFYYSSSYVGILPPVNASYEIGLADLGDAGVIGAGPFLSYATARTPKYNYSGGEYWWRYTYISVGARGMYHYNFFNDERFDPYFGLMLGYTFSNYTYKDTGSGTYYSNYRADSGFLNRAFFGGVRYKVSDKFGLYGELGWGYTLLNIGLNLKFK